MAASPRVPASMAYQLSQSRQLVGHALAQACARRTTVGADGSSAGRSLTAAMLSPPAETAAPTVGPACILAPDRIELLAHSAAEARAMLPCRRIAISPETTQQEENLGPKAPLRDPTETSEREPT